MMKCTSFEHEVSKERRANLKDLFKAENLDPIPVEGDTDDDALEPSTSLLSIASKSMTMKIDQTRNKADIDGR